MNVGRIFARTIKTNSNNVRVRFAPSPTGYLHLGGLRTALYNYLFARSNRGTFILRIEDTDQTRIVSGAREALQKDLEWAGIQIDEGPDIGGKYGPYFQSQRIDLYHEKMRILVENGSAYRCFCTDNRLELLRKDALKRRQVPKYDNRCRFLKEDEVQSRLEKGDPHCIRFKLSPGDQSFNDLIFGQITCDISANEGDPIIIKSDGFPTYHFANVVDDHQMRVSHVLRGTEWQISTTKHLMLYKAFGWDSPVFGHLPLLLNADGTKLSKRQGDIRIGNFRESGIFPLALVNYIVKAGGGFEKDLERGVKERLFTMEELVQQFDVGKLNCHSGKLMPEKLLEFNKLEIERRLKNEVDAKGLVEELQSMVKKTFPEKSFELQLEDNYVKSILWWAVKRINKLDDLTSKNMAFIWVKPAINADFDVTQVETIKKLTENLSLKDDSSKDELNAFLKNFAEKHDVKYSAFMKNLRIVLSGLKEGPSVAEMIQILGKENTLSRLQSFLKNQRSKL